MSLTLFVYSPSGEVTRHESLDRLDTLVDDELVWLDIETDDEELLSSIADRFALHELTIEDCLTPGHFPKLDDYGRYLFLVFRCARSYGELEDLWEEEDEEGRSGVKRISEKDPDHDDITRKICLYVSKSFVITFRRREVGWLDALVRQVSQYPEENLTRGPIALGHRVIDVLVDRFTRSIGFFEQVIEDMEDTAIGSPDHFDISDVLDLKRELTRLMQMVRAQRAVISKLASSPLPLIDKRQQRYFKDIDDHAVDIVNILEKQIDALLSLRDAFLAQSNVRLGDIMRILAIITTIAAPLNLVVGIYGMNFDVMPFLHSPHGFWLVISFIVLSTVLMLVYFRTQKWL